MSWVVRHMTSSPHSILNLWHSLGAGIIRAMLFLDIIRWSRGVGWNRLGSRGRARVLSEQLVSGRTCLLSSGNFIALAINTEPSPVLKHRGWCSDSANSVVVVINKKWGAGLSKGTVALDTVKQRSNFPSNTSHKNTYMMIYTSFVHGLHRYARLLGPGVAWVSNQHIKSLPL